MAIPRVIVAALAAAVLVAVHGSEAAAAQAGDAGCGGWDGTPTRLGGFTQLSRGELVHTDYHYDDYGPDLNRRADPAALPSPARSDTAGDYRYPDSARYLGNGADLRELRLALGRQGMCARIALQTLVDETAPIATIAIDADADRDTGPGSWPAGAETTTPGADLFLTISGRGAWLDRPGHRRRQLPQSVDLERNMLEARIPSRLLPELAGDAKVWAGVGLADGDRYAPQGGGTAIFDLAFQGAEDHGGYSTWSEQQQSAALASPGPGGLSERMMPQALRRGKSRPFRLRPGFYNRISKAPRGYGEGIDRSGGGIAGGARPQFLGAHQPYGLYVPTGFRDRKRLPLLLDLHSLGRNHNQYGGVLPNRVQQLGEERHSLVITPLNRGTDGWYLDSGLLDVLTAWRDVRETFPVDRARTALAGYSMGGYGSYRLGLLMPDRFARVSTYVGPPVYGAWFHPAPPVIPDPAWRVAANTNLIVGNAINLPFEINAATKDELVPYSGVAEQVATFRELGNPYRFYRYDGAGHLTLAAADEWSHTQRWLGSHRRVRNPARVRYERYPEMDLPDAGLHFDGAYWVDRMRLREEGGEAASGSIDATTLARADELGRLVDEGRRQIPGSGSTPAAVVTGQHYTGRDGRDRNAFSATLRNLGHVELDARRMGLETTSPIEARLAGDGATTMLLRGHWPARVSATLDGRPATLRRTPRGISIELRLQPGHEGSLKILPGRT
jgi:hypothetical protein